MSPVLVFGVSRLLFSSKVKLSPEHAMTNSETDELNTLRLYIVLPHIFLASYYYINNLKFTIISNLLVAGE